VVTFFFFFPSSAAWRKRRPPEVAAYPFDEGWSSASAAPSSFFFFFFPRCGSWLPLAFLKGGGCGRQKPSRPPPFISSSSFSLFPSRSSFWTTSGLLKGAQQPSSFPLLLFFFSPYFSLSPITSVGERPSNGAAPPFPFFFLFILLFIRGPVSKDHQGTPSASSPLSPFFLPSVPPPLRSTYKDFKSAGGAVFSALPSFFSPLSCGLALEGAVAPKAKRYLDLAIFFIFFFFHYLPSFGRLYRAIPDI